MKVLFIIPSYKPAYVYGGPIYSVSRLAETLVRAGHDVTVFTTTANGDGELDVKKKVPVPVDGVTVYYFNRWTRRHSHFSPSLLLRLISSLRSYDIIHVHSWWNLVAIPAVILCLLAGRIPVISPRGTLTAYTLRHRNQIVKRFFHSLIGRRLLANAALVFTTHYEWKEASRHVTPARWYILPNILHLPFDLMDHETSGDSLKILFLGRIDPAKNLELIIDSLMPGLDVDYHMIIAGDGKDEYVKALKDKTKSNPNIEWIGPVFGERKVRLLANADVLVLPSHTENYGNVVLESLSQGTLVLVSPHVGIKDYVVTQGIGFVVEDHPGDWKLRIEQVAMNKSLRDEIRLRAPALIQNDFDPAKIADDYVKAYREIQASES